MSNVYIGEIRLFAFPRVPNGWLACDGQSHAIEQYETLYKVIGTTYGGDGDKTFMTPSLVGRVPLHYGSHQGSFYFIGEAGGSEKVTLNAGELPTHTHPMIATQVAANSGRVIASELLGKLSNDTMYTGNVSGADSTTMSLRSTSRTGGVGAHDNLMPTLTANFCIAFEGIFPSQG